jgi:hypothetical protein
MRPKKKGGKNEAKNAQEDATHLLIDIVFSSKSLTAKKPE